MNGFKELFKDTTGKTSLKRAVAALLIALLCTVVVANVFFTKKIDEFIYDGLVDVVIWGLAFIGSEKVVESMSSMTIRRRSSQTQQRNPRPYNDNSDDGADI